MNGSLLSRSHLGSIRGRIALAAAAGFLACASPPTAHGATLLQLSARVDTTCAVITGTAYCWGYNSNGQVGNGTTTNSLVPVPVTGLASGVTKISTGGAHTCAVASGGAWCWGMNTDGQLGNGTATDSHVPVPVTGLGGSVVDIAAGDYHSCAVLSTGTVKCWGANLSYGQLGNGTSTPSRVPVTVSRLTNAVAVSAGRFHTCAVNVEAFTPVPVEAIYCWGQGNSGELGDGLASAVARTPVRVSALANVDTNRVSGGGSFTCGTRNGDAFCWGFNGQGQLGNLSLTSSSSPIQVNGLTSGVSAIAAGSSYHACAIQSGSLKCWGYNNAGQLGNPAAGGGTTAPTQVSGLSSGVVDVAAGGLHTCATTATGVYCWGSNSGGQLGIGNTTDKNVPQSVFAAPVLATTLSASATSLAFGGQSINTTSPTQTFQVTNTGSSSATISSVTLSGYFTGSTNCSTLAPGAGCTIGIAFTPTAEGALTGSVVIQSSAGMITVDLTGTGERSLVTHYYRSILQRAPDAGGEAFWDSEAARVQSLGVNVNEVWFAMAGSFYGSGEYAALNRDNTGFVTDLYNTFFNRAPDAGGLTTWTGALASGMPREVVLASFMFSSEFATFTQAIFGTATTRKEIDTVTDFYRGVLGRLPDDSGFNYWLQQFRLAQCQGAAAVTAQAESISSLFVQSGEYGARGRTDAQFVGDLYNAFLRRGGDLAGVQFWIGQVTTGAMTRDAVRRQFVASPEFSARVAAVTAQGCLP